MSNKDNVEANRIEGQKVESVEALPAAAECDCQMSALYAGKHLDDCASLGAPPVPPGGPGPDGTWVPQAWSDEDRQLLDRIAPAAPAAPSYPPGYNPAVIPGHLPGPQHPADVAVAELRRKTNELMRELTPTERAILETRFGVSSYIELTPEQESAFQSMARGLVDAKDRLSKSAPPGVPPVSRDDERRRAIARAAAEDFARTNAKASAEAMDVLSSSAGAIMVSGTAYKANLLLSLLVRAFISGAGFGTQLAMERLLDPDELKTI